MLLTEKHMDEIGKSQAGFKHQLMAKEDLNEWFEMDGQDVPMDEIDTIAKIAQLQEKYLNETNFSANIASFIPKIQPLLRRISPKLMAFDLAGVQPVSSNSSQIFMIKAQYAGTTALSADKDDSIILESTQGTTAQTFAAGDTLTSNTGAVGVVVYVEPDYSKAVVNVTSGTFVAGDVFDVGASYVSSYTDWTATTALALNDLIEPTVSNGRYYKVTTAGTTDSTEPTWPTTTGGTVTDGTAVLTDMGLIAAKDITVTAVYSNEAGFKKILPNYSGAYTTAAGEVLGSEMKQLRVNIVSQNIEVKSRKLKAELTLELIKDMQAMHGASADKEIMFFLELEIVNDMNTEIIDKFKEISTLEANFAVATTANTQGRWSQEMYSGLWDRFLKDKRNLASRNQRGQGNKVVATAGVISAWESLGKFKVVDVANKVSPGENHSQNYVGTLVDGTAVYQDWFAGSEEYYMVIYKGPGAFDNALVYSPYSPLELLEATNPNTFQPILGLWTRYGLTINTITDSSALASEYVTMRNIDFVNTPLSEA